MLIFASEKIANYVWTMTIRNFETQWVLNYDTENFYGLAKMLAICK